MAANAYPELFAQGFAEGFAAHSSRRAGFRA
jgi:hypothetical protein